MQRTDDVIQHHLHYADKEKPNSNNKLITEVVWERHITPAYVRQRARETATIAQRRSSASLCHSHHSSHRICKS